MSSKESCVEGMDDFLYPISSRTGGFVPGDTRVESLESSRVARSELLRTGVDGTLFLAVGRHIVTCELQVVRRSNFHFQIYNR